jgi:PIN domain nuclease of toxin-antitoxin system
MAVTHEAALLDSHTFLWFDSSPNQLSAAAIALIRDPNITVYVSSLTAWELGIKHANGKLFTVQGLPTDFHGTLSRYGFVELQFSLSDALRAAQLPNTHKDPFDRGLSAQALERGLALVSVDPILESFGVTRGCQGAIRNTLL